MLYINVLQQLIEDVYNIKDTHCTDMSDFAYPSGNGFFPGHMCTPFPPDCVGFGLVNLNFFFVVCLLFCHFHYYHCIVCPSIYGFWFHYLPLYCLSFDLRLSDFLSDLRHLISTSIYDFWFPFDLRLLISPSIYGFWFPLRFTASDFHFDLQLLISPSIYGFWFPLRFTASDFPFDLRLLISPFDLRLLISCFIKPFFATWSSTETKLTTNKEVTNLSLSAETQNYNKYNMS
jgi:hypothetical protein